MRCFVKDKRVTGRNHGLREVVVVEMIAIGQLLDMVIGFPSLSDREDVIFLVREIRK